MSNVHLEKALAIVAGDFARKIAEVRSRAEQMESLELAGLYTPSAWSLQYGNDIEIPREKLPELRKTVGRLSVAGKYACGDFDETGEIWVTLKPVSEKFSALQFRYRTKFRNGGKCHIETVSYTSTSKQLVCKA